VWLIALTLLVVVVTACGGGETSDTVLMRNTYSELVDWHISGLWVVNCPVAWVRIANYNNVPIKDIQITYKTYDYEGKQLNTTTLEGEVAPGNVKNFIEQYLGLVDLRSEKLSVQVVGVSPAN
jgi:hypothetical protein